MEFPFPGIVNGCLSGDLLVGSQDLFIQEGV